MPKSLVTQLQKGDVLSETQYYRVGDRKLSPQGPVLELTNERGFTFGASPDIVEEGMYSSHQFSEERKLTKTELAKLALSLGDSVFEASFQKQPSASDINDAIQSLNKGSIPTRKEIATVVAKAYEGETRILRGYKISNEAEFGRIKVVDLEKKNEKDPGYRLIDLRTLNYLIYQNVKYSLKS